MRGRSGGVPCHYMLYVVHAYTLRFWCYSITAVYCAEPPSRLPPCLWPGSLPAPFLHHFPAHPPTALCTSQVSSLSYFFLLPAKPCSSTSYSAKSLLHQSLESAKGQFIFMNVYIKYNLPKHSLFLVRLTKQNIFSACGPSHFEGMTSQKKLGSVPEVKRGMFWHTMRSAPIDQVSRGKNSAIP